MKKTLEVIVGLVVAGALVLSAGAADAATTPTATTGANAPAANGSPQSYNATAALSDGTIVQLSPGSNTTVQPLSKKNNQNMFGVTVNRNNLLITTTGGTNQVYVAVSGTYNVLVSTENGTIQPGDYVTISSLDGVGMKANTTATTVLGRAASGFDGKSDAIGQESLHDQTTNTDKTVAIGSIPVSILIEHNPLTKSTKADVPNFLQRLGQQIADKQVSPIRIYLSMAITAVSLITAIIVLYAGVRNSMIAIGRNPMSRKSVFRALAEIILTAVLVLVIGLFAVYLLLKL